MIFVILPAYNEEKSLDYILPKISEYFKTNNNQDYKLIICNDGSSDGTLVKIEKYARQLPIEIINHKINRGLGETVRDLFERAAELAIDDDIIIRMDCDDTHEPEFFTGLLQKLEEGYDVAIASRFAKGGGQEGVAFYRKFISFLANMFMKLFFPVRGLREYSSGFRAYRASIIKRAISEFGNNFIQLKGLGFTCTLEKLVKLKMLGASFGETPFILKYNQKRSPSKMIISITTLGYLTLALLYNWPWGGWKSNYRKKKNRKISVDTLNGEA